MVNSSTSPVACEAPRLSAGRAPGRRQHRKPAQPRRHCRRRAAVHDQHLVALAFQRREPRQQAAAKFVHGTMMETTARDRSGQAVGETVEEVAINETMFTDECSKKPNCIRRQDQLARGRDVALGAQHVHASWPIQRR
jgi:hypothetical protein